MITVSTVSVSIVAVNLMVVVAVLLGLVVCGDYQGSLWLCTMCVVRSSGMWR